MLPSADRGNWNQAAMARQPTLPPPRAVAESFGVTDQPQRLPGGEGRSWRLGNIVLKPADDVEEADWTAEVLSALDEEGFRVERPVRSRSGSWVEQGWRASRWLDGSHDVRRWPEVLKVGELFSRALAGVGAPPFLDRRISPWTVADRVAWGETTWASSHAGYADVLARFTRFLEPLAQPRQLIHGDLTGNILFAGNARPAVIDFSPYYRPAGFALAVVVADAIAWHGADTQVLLDAAHINDLEQLIARAAIYRLVAADAATRGRGSHTAGEHLRAYKSLLRVINA